jgi:hypothetical protein
MRARIAFLAVIGVMAASAHAGVLTAPAVVLRAPVLVAPVISPALALTTLLPVASMPGPMGVPAPLAASPVPLAVTPARVAPVTPIEGLKTVAASLGDASAADAAHANDNALNSFWNGRAAGDDAPEAPHIVDQIVTGGASPEFVGRIKAHLKAHMPEAILRDMHKDGYRIEVNARVRQGREYLREDNDYTGGYHTYGPKGKFIVIAEEIKQSKTGEWKRNTIWENSITHEIGHAASYVLGGLSETPAFKAAWTEDLAAMPDDLKAEKREDGFPNRFKYFTQDGDNAERGRSETFAEGFDVLLRGEASHFNHAIFTRRFPKVLAEIRASLERVYGPIFVK